jgi:hypothetical protein
MAKKAKTSKTGKPRSLPTRAKKAKAITGGSGKGAGNVVAGWDLKSTRRF